MSTIPKYILNRNGGGGGGGGSLNPEDLKTVGYDSLIKDTQTPVVNVDFLYQQAEAGYPGGYLRVGQQRVAMRTINGEPLIGNTDIQITPGDANMVAITWKELKYLRDNNQLVPGTWYRINNYSCTTSALGTNSAGNNFDIIVLATSTWHLDENAFACRHFQDTYFSGEHLEAWRLKYCLDNDKSRFDWAQNDGRGVVYWMRDEWGNEAPYDFKNIRFARWAVSNLTSNSLTAEALQSLIDIFVYNDKDNPFFFGLQDTDYTQGGLTFHIDNKIEPAYYYTFGGDTDQSINGNVNGCYGNVIKTWIEPGTLKSDINETYIQKLNNGVWVKTSYGKEQIHHSTTCGANCHDFTCGANCHDFTCGNNCYNWTCGNNCFGWTCGNNCYNWTCGYSCYGWTCGANCHDFTCGYECYNWTCGNSCYGWTCGNQCHDFTCGDRCSGWTCGNQCYNWTCGNKCIGWTCGNSCFGWTCGDRCSGWTCGNVYVHFHILDDTTGDLTNTITPGIANYTQYVGLNSSGMLIVWVPADLVPAP